MAHLTRPAVISGVSAGSFAETAAGNRAYLQGSPPIPDTRDNLGFNKRG